MEFDSEEEEGPKSPPKLLHLRPKYPEKEKKKKKGKAEGKSRSNWRDMDGNICSTPEMAHSLSSDISDTTMDTLRAERRQLNVTGPFEALHPAKLLQLQSIMRNKTALKEYLMKQSTFEAQKMMMAIPEPARSSIQMHYRRWKIERKNANQHRNSPRIGRNQRIWTWTEIKNILLQHGYPTKRLERRLIGVGKVLNPRNKYIDQYPEDLELRRNDSDAVLERKRRMRDEIIKRGLLEDALNVDLKQIKKEKLKKQLNAKTEKEFRLKLKMRKLLWKKQAKILTKGQRGMRDHHHYNMRPKHLHTGKMKPWKKTRGRGYRGST